MNPYVVLDTSNNEWKEVLPFPDDRLALEEWRNIIREKDWFDSTATYKLVRVSVTSWKEIDSNAPSSDSSSTTN